ncbi:MAG: hypothetical protein WEB59_05060 [Thermoanaerobaculia bacterium]
MSAKSTCTRAEASRQDDDVPVLVHGNGQIDDSVEVEVAGSDEVQTVADRIGRSRREATVSVAQQDQDIEELRRRQIRDAVAVEVADGEPGPVAARDDRRREPPLSVAQVNRGARSQKVLMAVAVEIPGGDEGQEGGGNGLGGLEGPVSVGDVDQQLGETRHGNREVGNTVAVEIGGGDHPGQGIARRDVLDARLKRPISVADEDRDVTAARGGVRPAVSVEVRHDDRGRARGAVFHRRLENAGA